MKRLASVTAAVVVLVLCLVPTMSAGADGPVAAVGWWTDRASAAPLGDGAFEVAASFDGTSVAAVEVAGTGPAETVTLVFTETGIPPSVDAAIGLCVLAGPFVPADGGPLEDAPATECQDPIEMTRGVDRTWSADATAVLAGTDGISLAVVPLGGLTTDNPVGFSPGFTAQFSGADVVVDTGASTTTSTAPPTTSPDSTTTTSPTTAPPVPTTAFRPPPTAIVPQPVVPAPVSPTTLPAPAVEPVAPAVDDDTADELAVPSFTNGPITGASGDGAPWARLLVLVPLSALSGYGAVFAQRWRARAGA